MDLSRSSAYSTPPVRQDAAPMSSESIRACPQCGQHTALIPVTELVTRRRAGWKRIAPPRRPQLRDDGTFGCLAILFTSIIATSAAFFVGMIAEYFWGTYYRSAAGFGSGETAVHAGILTFILVFVVSFYIAFAANQKRESEVLQPQLATWRRMMAEWQTLLYCEQCDSVFSPTQNRWVSVTHMRSLLKDETPVAPDVS
jgi:hypothetical protein